MLAGDFCKELDKINLHDHCSLIYESEKEWQDIVLAFIIQGLVKGEKCVYVVDKREIDYIATCLASKGVNVSQVIESGQLLLVKPENVIDISKSKDPDQVINIYLQWLESFMEEEYSAIRISSEALFRISDYQPYAFLELQLKLNRDVFPRYPLMALCQYHRYNEHPLILRDALFSNMWLIKNYRIFKNPFYISPEFYFREKNKAWEAEYWLRTHETLLESEEKYRLIVENCLDMISILDASSFEMLFASPSNYSTLGYLPEQMIGYNCLDFIHPKQQQEVKATLQEEIARGEVEMVFQIKKKDGAFLWLETKGKVIHQQGSEQIIIFGRDIHEKKLAEEALRRSRQQYKNQLAYLNTLINTMNELYITYDRKANLTFVNQRMLEKLGYKFKEVIGRSVLDFLPQENREFVSRQIRKRLDRGDIGSFEQYILHKDGSQLLLKVKTSPIIADEEIVGGLVLAEDITQQRKLERQMARLAQLNTVGEIAASIGHEIRNPMTTVQGFLQIMSQNKDFQDHQAYFELMLEEMARANSILEEFLTLAKDRVVDLRLCNLNSIIKTMAPLLIADAVNGDKNIKLDLKDVPDLLLDEKEIRQLVLNLVRNGLEAMHQGGTVTISTSKQGDAVLMSIKDEGAGIAAEVLDKLGTPFFSTKVNGTGLGLAVCHSIATRHDTEIIVDTSSKGTTFHIPFRCSFRQPHNSAANYAGSNEVQREHPLICPDPVQVDAKPVKKEYKV